MLRSGWLWAGVGIAVVLALPNLVYQVTNDWPQLAMGAALADDNGGETRVLMWPMLLVLVGPLLVPIWVTGIVALLRRPEWRDLRLFAVAFVVVLAFTFVGSAQFYYPLGLVQVLLALGCVPVAAWMRTRWRRVVVWTAVALNGVVSALIALPLLPEGVVGSTPIPAMNQVAADSIGWPTYVAPDRRGRRATSGDDVPVITSNYGEAGAIARFGPALGDRCGLQRAQRALVPAPARRMPRTPRSSSAIRRPPWRPCSSRARWGRGSTTASASTMRNRACPSSRARGCGCRGPRHGRDSRTSTDGRRRSGARARLGWNGGGSPGCRRPPLSPEGPVTTALPPVRPWRLWLVWGVGVAAYVLSVTNRTSLSSVGVDAAVRFDADASALSMFAVIQLAVYGAMQIPVGLLLDRYGARPIITAGMVLMASGQLVMAFASDVGIGILARVLIGAGDAAVFPSVLRLIAVWFPDRQAPVLVQFTGLVGQLGQIISILPLAALLHATSWSVAFGSLAGLGVLFAILTFAVIRNHPPDRDADVSVDTETGAIRVVTSAADLREGFRESWAHPATRLAFWSHFATPFAGTAFVMLWGFPFLTAGEGLSPATASLVVTSFVIFGIVVGPVIGALSSRHPMRRSRMLVLPTIAIQAVAWLVVIVWPGPAPLWLLFALAFALGTGGPASMIAFDHARTFNPSHRLSTATGIVNGGGFLAGLLAILFIGIAMDAQGAGTPDTYSLEAFRLAFLTQVPLWALGAGMIIWERKRTRVHLGLDEPRSRRRDRWGR